MNHAKSKVTQSDGLEALLNAPFVFWTCPHGCKGIVDWNHSGGQSVATCKSCGVTSVAKDSIANNSIVKVDGAPSARRVTCPQCLTHSSSCHRCNGLGKITIPLKN